MEERKILMFKIFSPIMLLACPLALYLLLVSSPGPVPVSQYKYWFVVLLNVFGFFLGLWGCWAYLGWFQKK